MRIRESSERTVNASLVSYPRQAPGIDNVAWLQAATADIEQSGYAAGCYVLLVGGADVTDLRLRFSQAMTRRDLQPSKWSQACLVSYPLSPTATVLSVPVEAGASSDVVGNNGVVRTRLSRFSRTDQFPNVALLALPIEWTTIEKLVTRFKKQRDVFDMAALLWQWLGYAWGLTEQENPLRAGLGLPSAVFVEAIVGACWRDMTPGVASGSSSPEAIWQGAKWWPSAPAVTPSVVSGDKPSVTQVDPDSAAVIVGRFVIGQELGELGVRPKGKVSEAETPARRTATGVAVRVVTGSKPARAKARKARAKPRR